jgi:hypothetical protein
VWWGRVQSRAVACVGGSVLLHKVAIVVRCFWHYFLAFTTIGERACERTMRTPPPPSVTKRSQKKSKPSPLCVGVSARKYVTDDSEQRNEFIGEYIIGGGCTAAVESS